MLGALLQYHRHYKCPVWCVHHITLHNASEQVWCHKGIWTVKVQFHAFLNLALDSSFTAQMPHPERLLSVSNEWEPGWTQSQSGHFGQKENLAHARKWTIVPSCPTHTILTIQTMILWLSNVIHDTQFHVNNQLHKSQIYDQWGYVLCSAEWTTW